MAQDAPLLSDLFPMHSSPKDARGAHGSYDHACHQEDATMVWLKKLDRPLIRPPPPPTTPLSLCKVHPYTEHITFLVRVQLPPPTTVFFSPLPLPSPPSSSLFFCTRCSRRRPPLVPPDDAARKKEQCFSLACIITSSCVKKWLVKSMELFSAMLSVVLTWRRCLYIFLDCYKNMVLSSEKNHHQHNANLQSKTTW